MAAGGLIFGILCGLTAALLVITTLGGGAGWFVAFGAYTVFGSIGLILGLIRFDGRSDE